MIQDGEAAVRAGKVDGRWPRRYMVKEGARYRCWQRGERVMVGRPGPLDTVAGGRRPPLLVIEVLSPTTYPADLDLAEGKSYRDAQGGVLEYLTLDLGGEFARYRPQQSRAWRLEGDAYRPWRPDRHGRWVSAQLGVAIGLEGVQTAI